MTVDDLRWFIQSRGVEIPCTTCGGLGTKMYSSGATWHGGMGTTKSERDICDTCWGTGDADRHGLDLRKLKADEDVRVAERAAELLARAVGASLDNCRPAIAYLIGVIDKVSNKRGAPAAPYLPELAQALANTLRRAIGATEVRKWR